MKKKQEGDVFNLFAEFQRDILRKPTPKRMFRELQMMKFKVRPLAGDVSVLNLKDKDLIEALWNLGKLDEFFQQEFENISQGQKKVFFQLFDNLHQKYQKQLNSLNLKSDEEINLTSTIEMEIFKEDLPKKRIN